MKKLIVSAYLAVAGLLMPALVDAQSWLTDPDRQRHHHISANEMVIVGFAGALLIAGLGYLALRRRESH